MQKKLIAEFIGAFALSLVVVLSSVSQFPISTPILAASLVALFAFTIGPLTGCHLNPAVTIGLASLRKISPSEAVQYIIAQLLAGVLAFWAASYIGFVHTPITTPLLTTIVFEFFGMIIFTFGIAAVVHKVTTESMGPIIIGASLFIGIAISALGNAAGILNPAVGVGLGVIVWEYYVAQIVGAIVGFQLGTYLLTNKKLL